MRALRLCLLVLVGVALLADSLFGVQGMALDEADAQITDTEPIEIPLRERRVPQRYYGHQEPNTGRYLRRWIARQRYERYRQGAGQVADE